MTPLRWIRTLLTRGRMVRDVSEEIELHLEEKTAELMAAGYSRSDATAAARRAFGNVALVREESRDVWRWRSLADAVTDVRYAARQLRRSPSFAAAAILTLAIGIGVNTAVFSVVQGIVFRPLPFPRPEALVSVESIDVRGGRHRETLSYFTFFEFRRSGVFDRVVSYRDFDVTLTGGDLPVHLAGMVVSWDLFDLLEVTPALGRGFLPSEEAPGARVVVLSHDVWTSQFGSNPAVVGRSVLIDGEPTTVVGIAPAGFTFPIQGQRVQVWTTLARDASSATLTPITEQRGARLLNAIARLRDGMSLEQAQAQLDAVAGRLATEYPDSHKNLPATELRPELERLLGSARAPLLILWGAVALVLLIACANTASMLLARTADRQRELAVRLAIGGSRRRIVRQLVTENLVVACTGAAVGVLAAFAIVRAAIVMVADFLPRAEQVGVDGAALAFTIGLALLTTVLVSVPPALWIGRTDFGGSMSGIRGSTETQERVRSGLVVAQVSIGLVLVCGASVLTAAFLHLTKRDLGFRPENLVSFRVELPRYSTTAQVDFIDRLLARVSAMPGVASTTAAMPLPLTGDEIVVSFNIEERPTGPSERPFANMALVTPGYFETIGAPLLEGRDFTEDDDERHPRVLVVNRAFADRFFPGQRAIGKRIESGASSSRDPRPRPVFREIVGIVGNVRQSIGGKEPEPIYYFPYKQLAWGPPSLVVRTARPATAIVGDVRGLVASLDPQLPVYGVKTLSGMLATGMSGPRFLTALMGSFAAIGLMLTATGLYGLLAYSVSRRTREIGVRMALGASRTGIVSMILRRALLLIGIGVVVGGAGAIAGRKLMEPIMFAFDSNHPFAWLSGAIAAVILTALAAAWPPAMRAAAIDPCRSLRAE
jgi:putative ABC transport system permease protein